MSTFLSQLVFHPLAEALPAKTLQAFQKDAGWPANRGGAAFQGHGRVQWVCVEYEKVRIGIARLELAPPEFCYVAEFIIKSKFQRKGVGRWMMRHIEDLCIRQGIRRVLLIPEKSSVAFYQTLSFADDPMVPGFLRKDLNPFQRKFQLGR